MNTRKPYEGLINEADMLKLITNIDNTPNVEWADYNIAGDTVSYPMWKAAVASEGDTYEDFMNYFKETQHKMNQEKTVETDDEMVGVVEPEAEFEKQNIPTLTESVNDGIAFGGEDLAIKVKRLMNRNIVVSDNTGVVKPKSEGMPTKTTKQVTEFDSTKENKPVVEISKKAPKADVGVVKAHNAMGTQTKVDITKGDSEKKGPNAISDKTGIVKPKSEGFKGGTKPITSVDMSVPKNAVVEKAAVSPKAGVGVVKPHGDIKPTPKPITFKDFLK